MWRALRRGTRDVVDNLDATDWAILAVVALAMVLALAGVRV